jgi:hypothetical protein
MSLRKRRLLHHFIHSWSIFRKTGHWFSVRKCDHSTRLEWLSIRLTLKALLVRYTGYLAARHRALLGYVMEFSPGNKPRFNATTP